MAVVSLVFKVQSQAVRGWYKSSASPALRESITFQITVPPFPEFYPTGLFWQLDR